MVYERSIENGVDMNPLVLADIQGVIESVKVLSV